MNTNKNTNLLFGCRATGPVNLRPWPGLAALCLLAVSCRPVAERQQQGSAGAPRVDSLAVVLASQPGESRTDIEIRRFQCQVRDGKNAELALEQLGWAFVAKARESFDPGFYTLAEHAARCLEQRNPQSPDALLLHGHVLQSLHRFKEAEAMARRLVTQREVGFDYGLLGDCLMEQGKLAEAVEAYQKMLNLKPDLFAYARVAHLRWLKGDLEGAQQVMRLAVSAASPQNGESSAWVHTRLASYEFQAGLFPPAEQHCAQALSFQSTYAPALLLRGKMLLAQDKAAEAVEVLAQAARLNPLPEYQWTLAEALRCAHLESEAVAVEASLRRQGAAADPRTLALFLATRGESPKTALRLAKEELVSRADVFTHDAYAWSLAAAGRLAEAEGEMALALKEGTQDGRLFFHAALVASWCGRVEAAQRWKERALGLQHLLLPAERSELHELTARPPRSKEIVPAANTPTFSTLDDEERGATQTTTKN